MDTTYPFYCIGGKDHRWQDTNEGYYQWASSGTGDKTPPENALYLKKQQCIDCLAVRYVICSGGQVMDTALPRRMSSNTNQVSREMTLEEWCEKVPSIHLINREFKELKDKAAYWEAKAGEYKALLENMERVG